jgi:hypothetical protein
MHIESLGFWGSFGINIIQFLSAVDIVRIATYPLLASVFVYFIAVILASLTSLRFMPWAHRDAATIQMIKRNGIVI